MKASSGSKNLSRSLLGSDAFVATGRARRVPPRARHDVGKRRSKSGESSTAGPLLNCTSESRRRALEGGDAVKREDELSRRLAEAERNGAASYELGLAVLVAVAACWSARHCSHSIVLAWCVLGLLLVFAARRRRERNEERNEELRRLRERAAAASLSTGGLPEDQLAACWESSERAPPLPLLAIPADTTEDAWEPWMQDAGVAQRWTSRERRFLARARRQYSAELRDVPAYLDAYGDRRFLRFLRQDPSNDEDRAVAKVGEYLRWRKASCADDARRRLDETPESSSDEKNPVDAWKDASKWPHGNILMECIRLLQCSETYYDTQGHAVTVYQAFHWPAPALRKRVGNLTTRQLVDFATFAAEFNAVQMDRIALSREKVLLDHARGLYDEHKSSSARRDKKPSEEDVGDDDAEPWHKNETPLVREGWGELTRLCAITDMRGCTFGSIAMPQLIPAVIQAVSIFVNYYPYIVGGLHVINCSPLVAKIFKRALQTVVPKHIADQVQIHVSADEILRSVRLHHLPKQIGGHADCPELHPPPPPDFDGNPSRDDDDANQNGGSEDRGGSNGHDGPPAASSQ